MNSSFAVICVTYNRCKSLICLLNSLKSAEYDGDCVDLIISIDKGNNNDIISYTDSFIWPYGEKIVTKHVENLGLKKHILECGNYLNTYDAIVILEDDLTVSPSYYLYARKAFDCYKNNTDIAGISLYSYNINYQNFLPFSPVNNGFDVYFMKVAMSWGQVWMKESWNMFKLWLDNNQNFEYDSSIPDGLYTWGNKSWLKYHMKYCIKENKYFVYPYYSLTNNNSEPGIHNKKRDFLFSSYMLHGIKRTYNMPVNIADGIRYDGFYEREFIPHVLNIFSDDGICMNIYGSKNDYGNSRYLVTCKKLKYHIIRSFALLNRPIETNLIEGNDGSDIFVYDMQDGIKEHSKSILPFRMYQYLHNIRYRSLLRLIFTKEFLFELYRSLMNK